MARTATIRGRATDERRSPGHLWSLLSGALLDFFDWRAVNYVAVPFLLATAGAILWLAASRRGGRPPALDRDGGSAATARIGFNMAPTALVKRPAARRGCIRRFEMPFS